MRRGRVVVRGADESLDPWEAVNAFVTAGAQWIHLVDLDRVHGTGDNLPVIRELLQRLSAGAARPRIQLSGGIQDEQSLRAVMALNPDRVNLACSALLNPQWVAESIRAAGPRIAVSLDVQDGELIARGTHTRVGRLEEVLPLLQSMRCRTVIVTDNQADGKLSGLNVSLLERVSAGVDSRIIVSGGVSSLTDIRQLERLRGVRGVIIGRALYEGAVDLKQALQLVGRELKLTDSAGQSWKDRRIAASAYAQDDGQTPPPWQQALAAGRQSPQTRKKLFAALQDTRVLVPLMVKADEVKEVASVTVEMPDGRLVIPVFTSAQKARAWKAEVRLVPNTAQQVAAAALAEGVELMVIDPKSEDEVLVRRPQLWALAAQENWCPPWENPQAAAVCRRTVADWPEITAFEILPGQHPDSAFEPEITLVLRLRPGLDSEAVRSLVAAVTQRLAAETDFVNAIDSMHIRVEAEALP